MTRRAVLIAVLVAVMLAGGAQQAFGWANGGNRGNGIGTHDWILARAIALAGADANWVNRTAAYRATDDPDSYGTYRPYHHYRTSGTTTRGAAYIVSDLYYKAVTAYRAGDYAAASKYLGTLSHYYSDVCQPFHTTENANYYRKLHVEYEYDVDDFQHKLGNKTYWITRGAPNPVTDIRARTISAARYANARYKPLRDSFRVSHRVGRGTPNRITREVQSRAANDLADIIRTIPTGEGLAPSPAVVTASVSYSYPRQYQTICGAVRCVDASGTPMEGVGVKLVWNLPTGTKTLLRFSDSKGNITHWQNIGKSPLMVSKYLTAYIPVSGTTTKVAERYTATKVLGSGSYGFKTTVANYRPVIGSTQTCYALARDADGHPVPGLDVVFTWSLDGQSERFHATTGSDGYARCSRVVEGARAGASATFTAETQAGGQNRVARASFVPQD